MLRLVIFSLLAFVVMTMPFNFDGRLDDDWELFKKVHDKVYDSFAHEAGRRSTWEVNVRVISKHNIEQDMGNKTYRMGINSFTDMSNQEFTQLVNGYKTRRNPPKATKSFYSTMDDLPDTVDWVKKGYVTPVKNQEQCGSCWAFSATGSLEGQIFAKIGVLPNLSEQNLVDCSYVEGDNGCNGGLMDDAFTYVQNNHGVDSEVCYKYEAVDEKKCHFKNSTKCVTGHCTGFVDIDTGDESELKTACATVGPISVAIDASHLSFQQYASGVYNEPECSTSELDHGVLIVGYGVDSDSGEDYWLVKNSWGNVWGLAGYIKMSRNRDNQCGIATSASYPLV